MYPYTQGPQGLDKNREENYYKMSCSRRHCLCGSRQFALHIIQRLELGRGGGIADFVTSVDMHKVLISNWPCSLPWQQNVNMEETRISNFLGLSGTLTAWLFKVELGLCQ